MLKRKYKPKLDSPLPEFFMRHVDIIKKNQLVCEECGSKLRGDVSEVAHIIPKSYFKSVQTSDYNVLYLCSMFSENNCHAKYDNSTSNIVKEMKIFKKVTERFEKLEKELTEKLNYKHYDRWQV